MLVLSPIHTTDALDAVRLFSRPPQDDEDDDYAGDDGSEPAAGVS
jgi:hypothetical protein